MSSQKINVLVFPSEGINAIELHDALSYCVNISLYGASSVKRHGRYIFENYISGIPNITEEGFIDKFNEILQKNQIDVVFPTHDTVAYSLVMNAGMITAKIISGDLFTAEICRSKIKTHDLFKDTGFVPERFYHPVSEKSIFPLFAKPDEGQGAVGACIIKDQQTLENLDFKRMLITEFLPGTEYTVDCLTDNNGDLRYVAPRTRDRMMAGVSVSGKTVDASEEIRQIAQTINSRLHFLGLWYFQVKEDKDGVLKLMEISTRCAGSMALTRAKGINLPLLSVYSAMGRDIAVFDNGFNVEMERYFTGSYTISGLQYDTVYIDFDDTITLNGKVNLNAIRFLYQCRNKGKNVVLLTRHIHDIHDTLMRYAISESLFSSIVSIDDGKQKSEYISPENAIFIDNMFAERLEVSRMLQIPVYDADQIEFLLDRRN